MIQFSFPDKIVVVTGGSKGVGFATAQSFLDAGASVAVIDQEEVSDANSNYGDRLRFWKGDVSSHSAMGKIIGEIGERFGKIDFLINNAGIQTYGNVRETSEEMWDRTINVNLKGCFNTTHFALPFLLKSEAPVVVNVASVQSFVSQQNVCAYTTAKTALLGFTRSVALDFAPALRCVAICPGTVDTPMLHSAIQQSPNPEEVLDECIRMHPLMRICRPEEVAALILYVCSSEAGFVTGQAFRIDGGLGISVGGGKRG